MDISTARHFPAQPVLQHEPWSFTSWCRIETANLFSKLSGENKCLEVVKRIAILFSVIIPLIGLIANCCHSEGKTIKAEQLSQSETPIPLQSIQIPSTQTEKPPSTAPEIPIATTPPAAPNTPKIEEQVHTDDAPPKTPEELQSKASNESDLITSQPTEMYSPSKAIGLPEHASRDADIAEEPTVLKSVPQTVEKDALKSSDASDGQTEAALISTQATDIYKPSEVIGLLEISSRKAVTAEKPAALQSVPKDIEEDGSELSALSDGDSDCSEPVLEDAPIPTMETPNAAVQKLRLSERVSSASLSSTEFQRVGSIEYPDPVLVELKKKIEADMPTFYELMVSKARDRKLPEPDTQMNYLSTIARELGLDYQKPTDLKNIFPFMVYRKLTDKYPELKDYISRNGPKNETDRLFGYFVSKNLGETVDTTMNCLVILFKNKLDEPLYSFRPGSRHLFSWKIAPRQSPREEVRDLVRNQEEFDLLPSTSKTSIYVSSKIPEFPSRERDELNHQFTNFYHSGPITAWVHLLALILPPEESTGTI